MSKSTRPLDSLYTIAVSSHHRAGSIGDFLSNGARALIRRTGDEPGAVAWELVLVPDEVEDVLDGGL